jgi:hypothetical protein
VIQKKQHLIRFVIGPMVIVAAFLFIEESRPFTEVWKPLAMYYGLALPAFFLVDWVKRRNNAKAA